MQGALRIHDKEGFPEEVTLTLGPEDKQQPVEREELSVLMTAVMTSWVGWVGRNPGDPVPPSKPTNLFALPHHICCTFLGPEEAKDEKGPLISHPNPVC